MTRDRCPPRSGRPIDDRSRSIRTDGGTDPDDANGDHDDGSEDPPVRPIGFVSDRAVVRRVGDRDLYLGNHLAASSGPSSGTESGSGTAPETGRGSAGETGFPSDSGERSDPGRPGPDGATPAFEHVLSLTRDPRPLTTHHHPLDDGPDNTWAEFAGAIDAARELIDREGSVLVHCKAGISRGSTVIAAAIAAEEGLSFREAIEAVRETRPFAIPHPALHERAVIYLAAEG